MSVFYTILKMKLEPIGFDPSSIGFLVDHVSVELSVSIVKVRI